MKRYIPDWADTTFKGPVPRVFGMRTPFSRLKLVGELYLNGWSNMAIAAYAGLSAGTVASFVKRAGLERKVVDVRPGETWQPMGRMYSVRRGKRP